MVYESKPTGITVDRQTHKMTVQWSDGHTSRYPFSLLRFACPCAECRGGHEHMRSDPDPGVFDLPDEDSTATRIQNVEAVGSYALTIAWEDGHHYGIYNWNYLRKLCPCPECRGDPAQAGKATDGE
jgi:DUF971 family protein